MKLPPKKRPGNPILASDWNAMVDALAARTPRPSAGLELSSASGGFIYRMKPVAGSSPPIPACPFGQIITWKDGEGEHALTKTGISGGVVYAGEQVWNIPPKELNLEASGTFCVWLEVGVTAYVEDGLLMPGIESSSEPVWKQAADYDDMVMPTAAAPHGKAILAVGLLVIKNGVATLTPTGCGGFLVMHCIGTLTSSRE